MFVSVLQLKANMMGTEYLLRGRGGDSSQHKGFNAQLLAVNYKPTINHIQAAPRTMTAVLPVPESKVGLSRQLSEARNQPGQHSHWVWLADAACAAHMNKSKMCAQLCAAHCYALGRCGTAASRTLGSLMS